MKILMAAMLLLACSCVSESGLVARGEFNGEGIFATNLTQSVLMVDGEAQAGIYQLEADGMLRLTRPMLKAVDSIVVRDRSSSQTESFSLGDPLPAWTEATIKLVFTSADIEAAGLTWNE